MATTLLSYHGDKAVKAKYLRRVRAHEKADEIVKGTYWQNGKGCAALFIAPIHRSFIRFFLLWKVQDGRNGLQD